MPDWVQQWDQVARETWILMQRRQLIPVEMGVDPPPLEPIPINNGIPPGPWLSTGYGVDPATGANYVSKLVVCQGLG